MNVRELRELETQVKVVARENADQHEQKKRQHKNFLYEEAKVRFIEKQHNVNKYGYVLDYIPWHGIGFAIVLVIVSTVMFNLVSPWLQGPQPYVPGERAVDVSSGKQRNASDFLKSVILYGNSKIFFDKFLDDEFPPEKVNHMEAVFNQLREREFDTNCSLAIADDNGGMDFDIEYSSGEMCGLVALRLEKDQQFKIINVEKWR